MPTDKVKIQGQILVSSHGSPDHTTTGEEDTDVSLNELSHEKTFLHIENKDANQPRS